MRRAAKTDANHARIVGALRRAGCGVIDLSAVGKGVPDLLVTEPTHPFSACLIEVKDGSKPPSARQLTPHQRLFHASWRGRIAVVTNEIEALEAVGIRHG